MVGIAGAGEKTVLPCEPHNDLRLGWTGILYVAVYSFLTNRKVTPKDQVILFATVFSHFFLELPVHRPGESLSFCDDKYLIIYLSDVKITPNDHNPIGMSLFDHRIITFLLESGFVWLSFFIYNTFAPAAAKSGAIKNPRLPNMLLAFLVGQQAFFCWGS